MKPVVSMTSTPDPCSLFIISMKSPSARPIGGSNRAVLLKTQTATHVVYNVLHPHCVISLLSFALLDPQPHIFLTFLRS
jgi:hypothetical protein